jgi:hypothetical protein
VIGLALTWLALAAGADGGLTVEPAAVRLVGSDASAQVLVAIPADGVTTAAADRTHAATYEVADPAVAVVEPGGLVRPLGDGATTLTVRDGERSATIPIEVEDFADRRPVGFVGQVVPILTKTGCNAGACHGKATGQNGFRLSLLGFDPKFDYDALVREGRGRRVFPAAPGRSLILRKPAALIPHGGGRRFAVGSPEYRTIERWVAQGMPFDVEREPKLVALDVQPARRVLAARDTQQLRVTARYDDGTTADITRLAQYQSNAADLATVDETGRVQVLDGVGEAAVMVRFGGQVAVARATIPRGGPRLAWTEPESSNPIDRLVFAKLRALNLPPSGPCTDAEFARRACLDLCGTLPTPEEVAAFEAGTEPDKRANYVDRLLDRPEYADYFASKWSAILRNTRGRFFGEVTKPTTFAFHAWVRQAIAGNMPYDRFAAAIIAAKGDPATSPAVAWYRTRDFNMPNDEALIEDTAQLFLGMRLQCAKCHHHPFERWGQDDYYGFASIFSRVGRKPSDDPFAPRVYVRPAGLAKHPQKGTEYQPKALGGPEFAALGPRDDPRDRLVDWLRQPDNPFFARAYVNRTWKHFFGRGLVEPEDDLRVTNPPTNPELLDALADEFVRSGYDMRHLIRLIATSAAYARSSLPDEHNAIDRQNFARYYPRRLPAEVLLDAINTVTGDDGDFGDQGLPKGFRAIQLPDEGFASVFLEVFGRPKRESVCECERTDEPSLAQRLHLLNSGEVEQKVGNGRRAREMAEAAAKDPALDAANVETLYRLAYARPPVEAERAACLAHLTKARAGGNLRRGYEDLVWVIINSKEFLFNR